MKFVAKLAIGALRILPAVLILVALFVIWELMGRLLDIPEWLLPLPTQIIAVFFSEIGLLFGEALVTLWEILIGFAVAVVIGITFALLISWTRLLERGLYPIVIGLQTLPILAITPLLIVWFGLGIGSKIVVIVLISFFPIVVNLVEGLKSCDRDLVNMMRILGASKPQILIKLQIPQALPYLFNGLKLAAVGAVIGAVVAEWVGASAGLGYLIKLKGPQFQTDTVFAAILMLVLIAGLLFVSVTLLQKWVLRNYGPRGVN